MGNLSRAVHGALGPAASQSMQTWAVGRNGLWRWHWGQRGFLIGVWHSHRWQDRHLRPEQLSHQPTSRSPPHHAQNSSRSFQIGSVGSSAERLPLLGRGDSTATARPPSTRAVSQNSASAPPSPYRYTSRCAVVLYCNARSSGPLGSTELPRGQDDSQFTATNDTSPGCLISTTAVFVCE